MSSPDFSPADRAVLDQLSEPDYVDLILADR